MKYFKTTICALIVFFSGIVAFSQEKQEMILKAIESDDSASLATLINASDLNECYEEYTFLSHSVRLKADKCLNLLLEKGADVNKACGGGKSPMFLACKYGTLSTLKKLEAKGVNLKASYPATGGWNLLDYAKKYDNKEIVKYLETK